MVNIPSQIFLPFFLKFSGCLCIGAGDTLVKLLKAPVLHSLGSVRRKLFNELHMMAFEFFLATRGAEVVCLSFKIYPKFCCFFVKHSAAHTLSLNQ